MVKLDYEKCIGTIYLHSKVSKNAMDFCVNVFLGKNCMFALVIADFPILGKRTIVNAYIDEDDMRRGHAKYADIFGYAGRDDVEVVKFRLNTWFKEFAILATYATMVGYPVELYREKMETFSTNNPLNY